MKLHMKKLDEIKNREAKNKRVTSYENETYTRMTRNKQQIHALDSASKLVLC